MKISEQAHCCLIPSAKQGCQLTLAKAVTEFFFAARSARCNDRGFVQTSLKYKGKLFGDINLYLYIYALFLFLKIIRSYLNLDEIYFILQVGHVGGFYFLLIFLWFGWLFLLYWSVRFWHIFIFVRVLKRWDMFGIFQLFRYAIKLFSREHRAYLH